MVTVNKIISRITETRWSKLYIATASLQALIIIILQALICSQNTLQASYLPEATGDVLISSNIDNEADIPAQAADRLGRIIWENIAFIGFQVWFLVMVFDATVYQNTAEILALAVLNAICAILGALQVVDGNKWLERLSKTEYPTTPLETARWLEIALSCVIMIFACMMAYLSYEMSRQFGWNIYKKIGADVQMQKMYRMFQFFVLGLKIDVFTQFLVSLFYVIQFGTKAEGVVWETGIQIVVTILILPMLYFARTAGSTESYGRMITFITFEAIVIVHYSLILKQTLQPNNSWYTWICLVLIGIILCAGTGILGGICMNNFGRGLKSYVQRGNSKKAQQDVEMAKNNNNNWQIDED
ncbi:hypothetical protein BDA99DRAFT_579292 [Phascolomyces articulosus]|uniref:Uncharacterized protein n=1 Tax=Phascolomyces articulosus TaxID=60185 RepID=A0AAD5K3G7_9FUNG|nr:hypothetical protein BDA99DRAFT_579292 [Phascolomyces articulosus]